MLGRCVCCFADVGLLSGVAAAVAAGSTLLKPHMFWAAIGVQATVGAPPFLPHHPGLVQVVVGLAQAAADAICPHL